MKIRAPSRKDEIKEIEGAEEGEAEGNLLTPGTGPTKDRENEI